jgi:serine/threonine protein phosphatase 1
MTVQPGSTTGRLLCVGDIHACAAELEVLLDSFAPTADDQLVFLGDYVDRGPASRETIDRLLVLRARLPATVFLRGNHEEMMLAFLGLGGQGADIFLRAGGAATLASYGVAVRPGASPRPEELRAALPPDHLEFLTGSLRLHFEASPYLFVHAGVRPGVDLSRQVPDDLLWIREEFLSAEHGLPWTVVFGHTPLRDVWLGPRRRIGLDTGCVYGGRLSGLDLTSGMLHQVRRGAKRADQRSVATELARL